jgi:hypothetical protein
MFCLNFEGWTVLRWVWGWSCITVGWFLQGVLGTVQGGGASCTRLVWALGFEALRPPQLCTRARSPSPWAVPTMFCLNFEGWTLLHWVWGWSCITVG